MKVENNVSKYFCIDLAEHAEVIESVLRRAVEHALMLHKQAGNPIAAWRDGKVVIIPAEEIPLPLATISEDE